MKKELTQKEFESLKKAGYTGENNIGDMIEFLGHDCYDIDHVDRHHWKVESEREFTAEEMIDALDLAIKDNL